MKGRESESKTTKVKLDYKYAVVLEKLCNACKSPEDRILVGKFYEILKPIRYKSFTQDLNQLTKTALIKVDNENASGANIVNYGSRHKGKLYIQSSDLGRDFLTLLGGGEISGNIYDEFGNKDSRKL